MELEPFVASEPIHPCVKCGACCGTFRVLFEPAEHSDPRYLVPKDLTEKVDGSTRAMLGTNETKPRCVALGGRIGVSVGCTVYANRPSCCREFKPSFEDGTRNERCDFARRNKGLRPLKASDYHR
jgi:Fe-S-cluster containining protein